MKDEIDLQTVFSSAESAVTQLDAPQASDYVGELQGEEYDNLTLAEKVELLECIFVVMKGFVKIGYGLDPVNKLIEKFKIPSEEPLSMIGCEDATDDER